MDVCWRPIANTVVFHNAVNANWDPVVTWWTNGNRQIAFGRGSLGFVLINAQPATDASTFGREGTAGYKRGCRAGRYCNVIHSNLASDKTGCLTENGQEVMPVTVHPDGKAHILVQPMDAVAPPDISSRPHTKGMISWPIS